MINLQRDVVLVVLEDAAIEAISRRVARKCL
jgi:hypothetical protein